MMLDPNNTSSSHLTDDEHPPSGLPLVVQVSRSQVRYFSRASLVQCIFLFLFGTVVLLAACGNLIVIWIVLAHRRMRTPTNYFLVNLACADVCNALFNIPFNGFYMVAERPWLFGSFMCSLVQAVSHISIAANVLTYVAISLDR